MKLSWRIYWLFFLALTLFYVSLTPGTIEGQGYNQENVKAANQVATNFINAATAQPLIRVEWTRHGFLEPLLQLPFVVASRILFGDSVKWAARLAIFQPILATSFLCLLILIWSHRLTSSLRWGVVLASTAGLGTLLWPYVYVGLETTQSLALLVVAYVALGREPKRTWAEILLFAIACAFAVAVKLNGVFLSPAVGFLIFEYFRRVRATSKLEPARATVRNADWLRVVCVAAIVSSVYGLNHLAKARYWSSMDAGVSYFTDLLVDSPLTAMLQAFSFFGSPNKSLILFSPVLALSFVSLGRAWRRQPKIVILALLTLGGLIAGFAIVRMWADETWGPRYLHTAIAPLILCLAAARSTVKFTLRHELPLLASLVLGFAVSLLGSLFAYGVMANAAIRSSQATLDEFQYDPKWNHIRFNWELTRVWVRGNLGSSSQLEPWPPHRGCYTQPVGLTQEKQVDLREFSQPQPILAQGWRPTMLTSPRVYLFLRGFCLLCLALSLAIWAWVMRLTMRDDA